MASSAKAAGNANAKMGRKTVEGGSSKKGATTIAEGTVVVDDKGVATTQKPMTFHQDQDDEDVRRDDTLYEVTSLQDYISRRVEPEDMSEIKRFLSNEDYEFFKFDDPNILFEKCCFSIAISDVIELDRIVAAAFFDDKPLDPDLKKYSKAWKNTPDLQKMIPINTLYMHLFAKSSEVPSDILITEVVAYTFTACSSIEYIIVECPNLTTEGPFSFCPLVKKLEINPSGLRKKLIMIYEKEAMFPSLKIREGRENDLDDLAPLLPMSNETIMKEFGKTVLTDVIALCDKNNQSVVAEWNFEAVGIISVNTEINYELLNGLFHLEAFHGLHKPYFKDEVNVTCYDTKNIADVPIEEMMEEARQAMDKLRGRHRRHRPEDPLPYTVEAQREECLAEYESDESNQVKSDEMHRQGHQFGTSVSDDIIQYGLRSPSPVNTLTEQQLLTARMENIKNITEKLRRGTTEGTAEMPDAEGEEEDEKSSEDYNRPSVDVLREDTLRKGGKRPTRDEKFDPQALNLLDFLDEFMVDVEVDDEQEEEHEEDVEFIAEPKDLAGSDESENDDDSPSETPNSSSETNSGTKTESSSPQDAQKTSPLMPNAENQIVEDPGEGGDEEQKSYEDGDEGVETDLTERTEISDQTMVSVIEDEPHKAKKVSSGVTHEKKTGKSRLWQSHSHHQGGGGGKSYAASMAPGLMGPLLQTSHTIAFFQHKSEFQRRWSDDTIYLGRTGPDRSFSFEEKIELMKKVWEVYSYMKQEGLTFEAVKFYLSPAELCAIEDADILTKGNLLKFLTLLLPDEKLYPFERYVKPKVPKYYGLPNALAIKIFNVEKKFTLRSTELFREIFRFFPNREYLIITIPQGAKEPAWLEHFVRVVPRIDCSYPNELFVAHKAYFTNKLKVRRARVTDIQSVIRLLETLKQKVQILNDFKKAVCCKEYNAFVVEVVNHANTPIVGLAIASDMEPQTYDINYQLNKHTYYVMHSPMDHAYMHHLIMYPIFQPFARTFIKEVMRIMSKTCFFQKIYPQFCSNETTAHQSLLNNMDSWIPVLPRKRIHYNFLNLSTDSYDLERLPPPYATDYQDPFAVIYFGKKFSYDQKINLNSRIVFVGASETTLSCIEKLICSSYRAYKRLTIIDQFGLPGQLPPNVSRDELFTLNKGGTSTSFRNISEWVQRLGMSHWANIVIGTVTRINRERKYIVVNNDRIVPYDILVLAPGRQFQRIDCPEPEIDDPNFLAFKKKSQRHKMQGETNLVFKKETPKPKNVFTVNTEVEGEIALKFIKNYIPFMKRKKILIFGAGLRCFACIKSLLLAGVTANRIVIIDTPNFEVEWEAKAGYNMTNTVRIPMEQELKRLGVYWVQNYEFSDWETCPISGLVKRSYFSSPTEKESKISFSTFAFFCFRHRRVNDDLVSALAESYILFQDGIIIDENFKTNDPNIYAAGPATTYKRILLASHHDHMYYQSEEVGHKLAEFLISRVGSEGGGVAEIQTLEVFKFKRPFVRAIELLGGWHYMVMRSPGAPHHTRWLDSNGKCEETCECTTEIVTGSVDPKEDPHQKYFKVQLDDQSRIVGIECMSKRPFSASNFTGLYGQHEVLLNKMMERLEKGETKDLYDHFCQPWFGAFCVDQWETFLLELQELYRTQDIEDGHKIADFIRDYVANLDNPESIQVDPNIIRNIWDSSGLKQEVELKFLAFLKFNKLALPMYARNDYVEDLLEERSSSTLYYPKVVKY